MYQEGTTLLSLGHYLAWIVAEHDRADSAVMTEMEYEVLCGRVLSLATKYGGLNVQFHCLDGKRRVFGDMAHLHARASDCRWRDISPITGVAITDLLTTNMVSRFLEQLTASPTERTDLMHALRAYFDGGTDVVEKEWVALNLFAGNPDRWEELYDFDFGAYRTDDDARCIIEHAINLTAQPVGA